MNLNNNNAQGQYYLTDIIQSISESGGDIRTLTTYVSDPEYYLLTSDGTQPMDLAMLEGILASNVDLLLPEEREIEAVANLIMNDRPAGQISLNSPAA